MKFETPFPEGFPEVGDVIRFTCRTSTAHDGVTLEQFVGKKVSSTVEVLIVGRNFDEATGLHYLVTADDCFKHICYSHGWESQGWVLSWSRSSREPGQFKTHRTLIHQLKILRKHR